MMTARQAAFEALMRVEQDQAYSNLTLDAVLKKQNMSGRDKSFAAGLFYGVLENKLLLNYNIAVRAERAIGEIDTKILVLLRMGLFQIFLSDSVPDAAAVNETVSLCRENGCKEAAGFVNGILRSAARDQKLRFPDPKKGKNKYYSVRYSCPEPIVKLWRQSYGDENTVGLLQSLSGRPPLCVRVNTLKTTAQELIQILHESGVQAETSDLLGDCLLLKGTGAIEQLSAFQKGLFHVQDSASQLCCQVLSPKSGDKVLDICSAPGGKTFTLAERMKNIGSITACDLYEARLRLVKNGGERLGIHIIRTACGDGCELSFEEEYDRVLCDVPCSGLGILRRKPELRYKDDLGLSTLPEIQYRILCNASKYVKIGGMLLYSTCTLNPAENHQNAERFLQEHKDFCAAPLKLPERIRHGIAEEVNELTLFPHITRTDGFFISLFQRK